MTMIEFWKMNGSGNDFILIDNREGQVAEGDMGRWAERICRRRESVGADGLIFVVPSDRYDFAWRFFNQDGGEAEMCGNGGRCVARFAYAKGIAGPRMTFGTVAGPIFAEITGRMVKVGIPEPSGLKMDVEIVHQPGWKSVDFINTGVPHTIVHVEEVASHPVFEQGRAIRYDASFSPAGTNADFIQVLGPDLLAVRTYERGVENETLACGTGAIASALVASVRNWVKAPVKVRTQGGEVLRIHFQKDGEQFRDVQLEGSTNLVYRAELEEEAFE
jgi:diaminopimelate epimerase